MIFAVDFDGTCVEHDYPDVGKDVPGAEDMLKRLTTSGHRLILWTMRSGKELIDAENWFKERGIPLFGVNANPEQKRWTQSPKAYAQIYIDDAAFGAPLIYSSEASRPYLDWRRVKQALVHVCAK